jgi:hypothetical protein
MEQQCPQWGMKQRWDFLASKETYRHCKIPKALLLGNLN